MLIVLHLPRTGGVSLRKALRRTYGQAFRTLKAAAEDPLEPVARTLGPEVRVAHGHVNFGLHRYLNRPTQYATVVREPIGRTLSHFRLANKARAESGREAIPLDRFLACPIAGNLQAELIAGVFGQGPIAEDRLAEQAAEHLASISTVGAFDDLDGFSTALGVGKLKQRNGWGHHPELSPAQERLIHERTAIDRLLYDLVVHRSALRPQRPLALADHPLDADPHAGNERGLAQLLPPPEAQPHETAWMA